MTRLGIEPRSPGPLANTLLISCKHVAENDFLSNEKSYLIFVSVAFLFSFFLYIIAFFFFLILIIQNSFELNYFAMIGYF